MKNIVFLDIDGPMIPGREYLFNPYCSFDQQLNPDCLRVLGKILVDFDAQIVFNTYHNDYLQPVENTPGLLPVFESKDYIVGREIHPTIRTEYPQLQPRLDAINNWLEGQKEEINWVALDDERIDHPQAYLVDFEVGLDRGAYLHCKEIFNGEKNAYLD